MTIKDIKSFLLGEEKERNNEKNNDNLNIQHGDEDEFNILILISLGNGWIIIAYK